MQGAIQVLCFLTRSNHCAHSLLPRVKSCTHYLKPKEHTLKYLGVIQRCVKSHLYPVASLCVTISIVFAFLKFHFTSTV